jgi:hypothetical protein
MIWYIIKTTLQEIKLLELYISAVKEANLKTNPNIKNHSVYKAVYNNIEVDFPYY